MILLVALAPFAAHAQYAAGTANPTTFSGVGDQITITYTIYPGSYSILSISGTSQIKDVPIVCQAPNDNNPFTCTSVITVDALDDMSGRFSAFAVFTGTRVGGTFEFVTSPVEVLKSGGGAVSLSVSSSPRPTQPGEPVTVSATINSMGCNAGLVPPGAIQVSIGSDSRTLTLVPEFSYSTGATVSFTTSALAEGSHPVSASYAGGGGCAAGTATATPHVVEPRPDISLVVIAMSTSSFGITFSAPVTGLTAEKLNVVSTAGPVTRTLTGSGQSYILTLTGMTQSGTLSVSVPASVAQTAAGSQNLASYGVSIGYTAAPVVNSVSPAFGPTTGGTSVTISGTSFNAVTAVTFAGQPASSYTVNSSTSITAMAPATVPVGTAGPVSVLVTASAGTSVANAFYTYQADQSIAFTSLSDIAAFVPNQTLELVATATSNLPVSFATVTPASCSVAGTTATVLAAGICTITADQAGNANYSAAPQASQSFAISPSEQTISFTAPPNIAAFIANQTVALAATATSNLPVSFTSATPAACSVTGTTASILAAGTCMINADQTGSANYNAAPQVTQSFMISPSNQTISFLGPSDIAAFVANQTVALAATATSNLPVSFASATPAVCSVTGTMATVLAAGTCTINADQAGNANYNAAPQMTRSFTISPANQSIAFTSTPPDPALANGPTHAVSATGGASSNPVLFSIDAGSAGICLIAGNVVSFIAEGSCVVIADQAGDANYSAAAQVTQTILVAKQTQSIIITSAAPTTAVVGGLPYMVIAMGGNSGNPIIFSSGSPLVCAVSGGSVSFLGSGTCLINADQAGDGSYAAAPPAQQAFAVAANTAPTANAGPNQTGVSQGALVTLDGTGSSDPDDGQVLTFTWVQTGGTQVELSSASVAQPTFTAPMIGVGLVSETLTFQLTVDDGNGGVVTDTVTITTVDDIPPTLTITGLPSEITSGGAFTATFTFSEPVTGFVQGDIVVTNAALDSFTGSGAIYTVMIVADGTGPVSVSVAAGAAEDMAGNPSLAAGTASVPLTATAETEEMLAAEALARNRSLLASQPDLAGFLSGAARGGLDISSQATGLNFDIATDPGKTVWIRLNGRWGTGDDAIDRYVHSTLGAHLMRREGLIFGAMVQADHSERTDGIGKVESDGWLIGPYFVARVGENDLSLSGSLLAGRTDLAVSPIGTYTDMVTSDRTLVTLSLVDEVVVDSVVFRPRVDFARVSEDRPAYVDGLGNTISAGDVVLSEASIGMDFETPVSLAWASAWLSGGLSTIHSLEQVDGAADRSNRGRIKLGLLQEFGNGGRFNVTGSFDGIGAADKGSLGLDLLYSYRF